EHRQRAGRILQIEVAVGHLPVRNRIPVALVNRRIEDLLPVEARMEQRPRPGEDRDRDERRGPRRTLRRQVLGGGDYSMTALRTRRTGRDTRRRGRTRAYRRG